MHESIGSYLDSAQLLGTARGGSAPGAEFRSTRIRSLRPKPFTDHYRHAMFHGLMGLTAETFQLLRQRLNIAARLQLQSDAQKAAGRRRKFAHVLA